MEGFISDAVTNTFLTWFWGKIVTYNNHRHAHIQNVIELFFIVDIVCDNTIRIKFLKLR